MDPSKRVSLLDKLAEDQTGTPEGDSAKRAAEILRSKIAGGRERRVFIEGVWEIPLAMAACSETGDSVRHEGERKLVFRGNNLADTMRLFEEAKAGVKEVASKLFHVEKLGKTSAMIVMLGIAQAHLIASDKMKMSRNPEADDVWTWRSAGGV